MGAQIRQTLRPAFVVACEIEYFLCIYKNISVCARIIAKIVEIYMVIN